MLNTYKDYGLGFYSLRFFNTLKMAVELDFSKGTDSKIMRILNILMVSSFTPVVILPKGEVAFRYCNGNYSYLYPSFETVKKRLAEVFSDNADSLIKSGLITEKEICAVIETLKTDFQHINSETKKILKDLVGERKDPVSVEAMEAIALEIKALRDKINLEFMYMDDRRLISAALELKDLKERYDEMACM